MVIHIMPEESDFDIVYNSLMSPPKYLSLGRHEDLLDIRDIQKVKIYEQEEVPLKRNMYIPVDNKYTFDMNIAGNNPCTIYNLTKEYEITKDGLRRWKKTAEGSGVTTCLPEGVWKWHMWTIMRMMRLSFCIEWLKYKKR